MKEVLKSYAKVVDERLKVLLGPDNIPKILRDSMNYSVFAGGKRLRPALNLMANHMMDGDPEEALDISCAIEMIHTYSLIHDDLPAMDNDTMRRGHATNHVVFGEAYAILAGDGLLNFAFETMLANALKYKKNMQNHVKAMKIVANASGPSGMIAGQCCDIEFEGKILTQEELEYVHRHKTGAMITASLLSGLILCSPNPDEIHAIVAYGERLGLVFQIMDDILDVTGSEEEMGKSLNKDEKAEKLTYPKLFGLEKSRELAKNITAEAIGALRIFGENANDLKRLAAYLLSRSN